MANDFQGQTTVITGGSAGLGLAIARAFWSQGARVCLLARDAERLQRAREDWRGRDERVACYPVDVTRDGEVADTFARIREEQGPVQVLVNAAGKSHRARIEETTPAMLQELWDLNLLGPVRCTRAALSDLLEHRGHVVNIGSLASKVVSPYLGAYPCSKHALAAYSHQLRLELEPRGLHVLLVCPGPLKREDAGRRYDELAGGLPANAARPGGGASLRLLDPELLAGRILQACRRRDAELVLPAKVRWLAALCQLLPRWSDSIVRRHTRG